MKRQRIIRGIHFEWSTDCWTHNVFRFFEMLFGRKYGKNGVGDTIRAEMTSISDGGKTYHYAHSFESVFVIAESYIRQWLNSFKFVPFKIYIPVLQTTGFPMPIPVSPYLFAIAIDSTTQNYTGGAGTTLTVTHTSTGSNTLAAYGILVQMNSGVDPGFSSCTYDGVSMTKTTASPAHNASSPVGETGLYIFLIGAPTTTTNANVVYTANSSMDGKFGVVISYSGAQSSSTEDSSAIQVNTATANNTVTTTTVAANCWTVAFWRCEIAGGVAGAGTTMRYNNGDGGMGDSNAALAAGSNSMTYSFGSANSSGVIASFAPFASAAASTVVHNFTSLGVGT